MARLQVGGGSPEYFAGAAKTAIGSCELREAPSKSVFFPRGVSGADPPPHDVWPDHPRWRGSRRASENASSKECLQFAHVIHYHVGNVRLVRCRFQCRVGQQATEVAFKRALNEFGQEGCDRLAWRRSRLPKSTPSQPQGQHFHRTHEVGPISLHQACIILERTL
jgi:hypothetical protein